MEIKGNISKVYQGDGEANKDTLKRFKFHISAGDNPHNVSAEQVGAYTKEDVDEKLENKVDKQTLTAHTENTKNPHAVTAEQVGTYRKENVFNKGEIVNRENTLRGEWKSDVSVAKSGVYIELKAYVENRISQLIDGAPEALDTLKEIADALENGDDIVKELISIIYTKEEADARFSLIGHNHPIASGQSNEGISQFEIEEISGNFKSFNNGVIEVSGKTLLGFLSLDYYTNATAQFKLLSGTAKVYYGIDSGVLGGGVGGFDVTSVVLTPEESVTVNAKDSITSLVDLGGTRFSENCLIIIEAIDAKIAVEAYKKSVYSNGFMSGEDAEKLQNTYDKEEIDSMLSGGGLGGEYYTKEEIDNKIGSIDTALDELHAYATSLIGGEA